MKYIECPQVLENKELSLFLAGGISNCPDWQFELVNMIKNSPITVLNPRRKNFPTNNPKEFEFQIKWEFEHLKKASAVSFWFPKETLCPITLYELGKQSATNKHLFIGIHPEYARKLDVEIQTALVKPEVRIVYSLPELAKQIIAWADTRGHH